MTLPASAKLTSVSDKLSAATTLLCGGSATVEEPIHLSNQHLQHPLTAFHILESGERVSRCQNTVRVDTGLAVETMPDHRRQVEQNGLHTDGTREPRGGHSSERFKWQTCQLVTLGHPGLTPYIF